MYAILEQNGRQYKVKPGDIVDFDLSSEKPGDEIKFDKVLSVSDGTENIKFGTPTLFNYSVSGMVLGDVKGKKITMYSYRRRKDSQVKKGHRQPYTRVLVSAISEGGNAIAEMDKKELENIRSKWLIKPDTDKE